MLFFRRLRQCTVYMKLLAKLTEILNIKIVQYYKQSWNLFSQFFTWYRKFTYHNYRYVPSKPISFPISLIYKIWANKCFFFLDYLFSLQFVIRLTCDSKIWFGAKRLKVYVCLFRLTRFLRLYVWPIIDRKWKNLISYETEKGHRGGNIYHVNYVWHAHVRETRLCVFFCNMRQT